MSKRRRGAVDDSDASESEDRSFHSESEIEEPINGETSINGAEDENALNSRNHRNRLRNLSHAKVPRKEEPDDVTPMHWPVVLKTSSQSKKLKTETDDDEYVGSASSHSSATEGFEDDEFEYSDGGFIVDSDDNVVPAHRNVNKRSRRKVKNRGSTTNYTKRRRRGRPRRRNVSDDDNDDDDDDVPIESDDEFSGSEGSIAEELQELRGTRSPARRGRNYRDRPPVDYTIPPPPTVEEVARATARAAESAAIAKARDVRARRLFDVRGPFGGNDVHTLFNLTREDLEKIIKSHGTLEGTNVNQEPLSAGSVNAQKTGASTNADIDPVDITDDVDFSMVGGLDDYISKLKEMISLPLLYPEIYEKFGITPPRGVLFHGPPGTGKTLMARALAASHKQEKVTFYMRKGADVLSKWIGESERQLRALFDEARLHQPSIIFFDEIDGLAPVRSAKQEQHHASIVSTLLALMDGMDNRGQVVVIGATNRPDSVDPALRRPGRFDREFYFPLPDFDARRRILEIHTQKWQPPLSKEFLSSISSQTKGYGGADLRALTTEAALLAIQRAYPQIYSSVDKLLLDTSKIEVRPQDFAIALERVQPSTARAAGVSLAQPLPTRVEPILRKTLSEITAKVQAVFPMKTRDSELAGLFLNDEQFEQARVVKSIAQSRVHRPRMLLQSSPGNGQGYLSRAIANLLEGVYVRELSISTLFSSGMGAVQPESAIVNAISEARQRAPSCILLPSLEEWATAPHLESFLSGLLRSLVPSEQVFVVGCNEIFEDSESEPLESPLRLYFDDEIVHVKLDTSHEILSNFFQPVLEFIKRSPVECLDAQEMPRPDPPKLPLAPKIVTETKSTHEESNSGVFSEKERLELRIRSQLKLKLGVILDGFRQRYRRFRKPVVDEQKLAYLFEYPDPPRAATPVADGDKSFDIVTTENDDHDVDGPKIGDSELLTEVRGDVSLDEPYVLTSDNMILETSTGKKYYNMDLETVEDRLWNGFYSEPQQFLEDMQMIYRDANVSGERERIHKASEMLANAQVAIDDISADAPFIAACKELHAKDARIRLQELNEEGKNEANGNEIDSNTDELKDLGVISVNNVNDNNLGEPVVPPTSAEENENPIDSNSKYEGSPHTQSKANAIGKAVHYDVDLFESFVISLENSAKDICLEQLEQLYAALSDIAWQHRQSWDRNSMIQSMDSYIKSHMNVRM